MPELPEVETIRRGLNKLILREKIEKIDILNDKSFIGDPILGVVVNLRRFGKALIIDLDNAYSYIIHLRMTGQLIYDQNSAKAKPPDPSLYLNSSSRFAAGHPSENFVSNLPNKQTRVILEFENGMLYFNDQRKFGFIKSVKTAEVENDNFIKKLAKEPWQMSADELYKKLQKHPKSSVKAAILDQTIICGLGNIYADESLFISKIHPERKSGSLTKTEAKNLLFA
ncbi:MAG: DNA-formamidopyrimidine glycosylase family protein, partial [Candidatus Saccharibacteria bacterium]|nr:DNA-formamidopyrimidine glycosylase family protein [Candidatus Saccharibacteria bacterium]